MIELSLQKRESKNKLAPLAPKLIKQKTYIGEGRSAKVYLSTSGGDKIATKTFTGEPVSKLILFILTGSANPYTWCEDAIQCAIIRRRLLTALCNVWFDDLLRLPKTFGYRWNAEHKAFEIDAEFISGQHAPLYNPLQKEQTNYISKLKKDIMSPLEDKLIESGFDGLVWQAGKGNPVAASNFMLQKKTDGSSQWIWIDLESGLPALFALNPFSTLFYYLPKCVKHKGWLFDDVDSVKLSNYLAKHKNTIITKLGETKYRNLCVDADMLSVTQTKWKSITRHQRSLYYAASQKKITKAETSYYKNKPVRWFLKSSLSFLKSMVRNLKEGVSKLIETIYNFSYKKLGARIYLYFSSARYRWGMIRWYLKKEIDKWESRKFFTGSESKFLKSELINDDKSAYLTDFSIHLGIKPFVKIFSFIVMPILMASGLFSLATGTIIILLAGPAARTLYTCWRMTHSLIKSKHHYPVIALIIGLMPVIGNMAYPIEIIYQSTGNKNMISKFILYSFSAKAGSKIPIWGGQDSEIEHFLNRLCYLILR